MKCIYNAHRIYQKAGGILKSAFEVGKRIRFFRLLKGFSQEALALDAGINTAFLGHLERGLKSPTISTLEKIVQALGISFEDFFADEKIRDSNDKDKAVAIERIFYLLKPLNAEDALKVADIVREIVSLTKL